MKEGVFDNISAEEYHKVSAISNSYLHRLKKIPALAKIEQEDKDAFLLGRAFHCLLLEGQEMFYSLFAIAPDVDKRTKNGKEDWAAFCAESVGKGILTTEQYESMAGMVKSVTDHPFAAKVLLEGKSEQSVFWTDKTTGMYCKCRPDRVPTGNHGVILDVKTTRDATQHGFTRSVAAYGYHRQAAFYLDGFNAASENKADAFIFIAVEKEPPYAVGCYTLSDADIDFGRMQNNELLEKEIWCREHQVWPNYESPNLIEINLPSWA